MPVAVEAEKNGIELGDMNKKLLQKIEELTMHLIQKDKEIIALKMAVEKVTELELKLDKLIKDKK